MKNLVIGFLITSLIVGCTNEEEKLRVEVKEKKMKAEKALLENPDYVKGFELYSKNDCSTCHLVKTKIQGPTYAEVAAKYKSDTAMIKVLAQRIIKGNKGVWGEIAMPAHPALSEADAIALVKYIYLLEE